LIPSATLGLPFDAKHPNWELWFDDASKNVWYAIVTFQDKDRAYLDIYKNYKAVGTGEFRLSDLEGLGKHYVSPAASMTNDSSQDFKIANDRSCTLRVEIWGYLTTEVATLSGKCLLE